MLLSATLCPVCCKAISRSGEECWYVAAADFPDLSWNLTGSPPALPVALRTMAINGERPPVVLIGTTFYVSREHDWSEITYFFNPAANGVPEGGPARNWDPESVDGDASIKVSVKTVAAWMRDMLPSLEHMGAAPFVPTLLDADKEAPH